MSRSAEIARETKETDVRLRLGLDGVGEDLLLFLVPLTLPVRQFGPADQVTGLGEGRNPFAVLEHGVPTDMIRMKMRAQYDMETLTGEAGALKILEKARLNADK